MHLFLYIFIEPERELVFVEIHRIAKNSRTVVGMDQIINTLRQYIFDNILFEEDESLQNDTSFLDNGIVDSTGILELIAFIEENYGIHIKDEEMIPDNLDSLKSIATFVHSKVHD